MNAPNRTKSRFSNRASQIALTGALLLGSTTLTGCNTAGEGLFSGAVLGTLTGLALGSLDGNAGEGALTGLIIGSAGGAIIGDQNQRERENSRYRGSDHRYDSRYRSSSHYGSSHRHHHIEWWEEEWCD